MLALIELPESLKFLHVGWFLIHAVAIALVFYLGMTTALRITGRPKPERKPAEGPLSGSD